MSDGQDRNADIKIMRVEGTSIHRVEVKFLDHITASIRWNDKAEDARSEVLALLRDARDILAKAFIEIDVDNEHEKDLDAEWAYYQAEQANPTCDRTDHTTSSCEGHEDDEDEK